MALVPRQGTRDRTRRAAWGGSATGDVAADKSSASRLRGGLLQGSTKRARAHPIQIMGTRVRRLVQTFSRIRLSHPVTAARHAPNARNDARRGTDNSHG